MGHQRSAGPILMLVCAARLPAPRPHRECSAPGSPAGTPGPEPLGRGEGVSPGKAGIHQSVLCWFRIAPHKSPRGSPPLIPQGGGGCSPALAYLSDFLLGDLG